MNHNSGPVKRDASIQEPERGRLSSMKVGRSADAAVAWYLHWRVAELIKSGMSQKEIAKRARTSPPAINHLLKNGKGVGPLTAAAFVELLGFPSRGALIDAADAWFADDGKHYALHEQRAQARDRERKLLEQVEEAGKSLKTARSKRRTA